jgi:hypothetical protein
MMPIGDIWLEHEVDDRRIAVVVAAGFAVNSVTVWPRNGVMELDGDVIVQRDHEPGDFPFHLAFTATPASGIDTMPDGRFTTAVKVMARDLSQSIFTQLTEQYPGDFLIVVPDGNSLVVALDDDAGDQGRIELTPESRRRWESLAAVAAAD